MRQNINVEDAFRLWVRTMLEQMLGDEPGNVRYGIFPVKQFTQIAIVKSSSISVVNNGAHRRNRPLTCWK